jgi:NAD(P)-dependent dehydrogenase (short-subunit alcohol dehydrogenase family)
VSEIQGVAIVTSAAGGIGKTMTLSFLATGIRIAGVDRDREPWKRWSQPRLSNKASELLTIQTGLTNDSVADEITRRALSSAASISSSTTPGSAPVQSAPTVGSAELNFGRLRRISGVGFR